MNKEMYCIGLMLVLCARQAYTFNITVTTDIVEQNVSSSVITLNVTGNSGTSQQFTTLFNDSSNWFEAREKCDTLGFKRLEDVPAFWYRWKAAAQTMRGIGVPENFTFWTGIYRPFVKSDSWYSFMDSCIEVTDELTIPSFGVDERCISARFVDYHSQPVYTPDICTHSYPYICYEWVSNATIYVYSGFSLDTVCSNHTGVESNEFVNATTDIECAVACETDITCFAYSYNFTNASCFLQNLFEYSTQVNFTILRSQDNVTFGVKKSINSAFSQNQTTSSLVPGNTTFPECIVDSVPRNYCQCQTEMTEEELQKVVDEIIKNLTIDPATTSKNKQKYVCTDDDRTYSRVTGSVAVCIVICFVSVPFLSDVFYLKKIIERFKRKRTKIKDIPAIPPPPSSEELYGNDVEHFQNDEVLDQPIFKDDGADNRAKSTCVESHPSEELYGYDVERFQNDKVLDQPEFKDDEALADKSVKSTCVENYSSEELYGNDVEPLQNDKVLDQPESKDDEAGKSLKSTCVENYPSEELYGNDVEPLQNDKSLDQHEFKDDADDRSVIT